LKAGFIALAMVITGVLLMMTTEMVQAQTPAPAYQA
jgi:hypothetical protein